MKSLAVLACVVLFLAFVALVTVPADDQCINECTQQTAGDLAGFVPGMVKRGVFDVEHHKLYNKVINRWTGQTVAIGCFGNVFNLQ